ncbi:hypothetical protein A9F06_03205 [Klebsiella pneumoniae]|nr:hypothetical protein A9F06_03205 [Klebsiella pneumoniae]OKB60929.1 hypothetical protein A9F07_08195 [Klebsiella pneumoniae]
MMSLWDALRMNMMISYQELVRTFPNLTSAIITQRYPPKYAKDQSVKAYRYAYDWPLTAMLRVIQGLSPGEADLFLELARSV